MSENLDFSETEAKVRLALGVPAANPEFVKRLRADLTRRTLSPTPQWRLRPAWLVSISLLIVMLIASAPRMVLAIRQIFGYVPGIGLVDSSPGLRVLAEPVSVTQAGVTLTVKQAIVHPDHVQIVFETSGIAPQDDIYQGADDTGDPTAFCGGVNSGEIRINDGDPFLRLPDGTMLERLFGGSDEYPENVFYASPVFKTEIPPDVTEMTMVLKCILGSRLGSVPQNWEVPLKLVAVPAGTVVGEPVIEGLPPSDTGAAPAKYLQADGSGLTVRLEKVVPQADAYSFFFSVAAQRPDDSLIALIPASAYLVDPSGKKIALIETRPWQPGEQAGLWELRTTAKPGPGPFTLVIEKVAAYYDTSNAGFEFDPGLNPRVGQTWPLDQTFTFGELAVKVTSARLEEKDLSAWGVASKLPGISFTFQALDGKTPIRLGILDDAAGHNQNGQVIPSGDVGPLPEYSIGLYFEQGLPTGSIPVTIYEASSLISGHWEFQWETPR